MKKLNFILLLLSYLHTSWCADEPQYPVNHIPDSLKANAKAVIRYSEEVFDIKSISRGTYSISYAITILNENGLRQAAFIQAYAQKLHRINNIKGVIYDASGKKVENLVQDKIIDQSMIAGYSLYEDSRVKYFRPRTMAYPFTVEYSFNIEFDGLFNLPSWNPVPGYNISVQKSTYRINCPENLSIRYYINKYTCEPVINKEAGIATYIWELQNIPAVEEQPFSGPIETFCPVVHVCPTEFEIEGYIGHFTTWDDFGKWIGTLNKDRGTLSEETISAMKELVKDCKTDMEKARKIYEFMQNKTRYLNIAIGIGGWQPIPAETVDRLGYGDCKALSNYMKSLLEAVGIKAHYTLIRAGSNEIDIVPDFPFNNFNHAILCVPFADDTVWLECTSQHVPFGYAGKFTDDRNALMVDEAGAKLVHTCSYSFDDNSLQRTSTILLDNEGNALLNSSAVHRGVLYDDKLRFFIAGTEDKTRMIHDEINIPGCLLKKFDYDEVHERIPAIKEKLELEIPRYATFTGSRMLVSLVPLGRMHDVPKKVTFRKSDVVIKRSVMSVDSVILFLPEGYTPESMPSEAKAESKFGNYTLKTTAIANNKVLCVRSLKTNKCRYSPETYNELVDFYKKVAVSDNMKISLKKTQI